VRKLWKAILAIISAYQTWVPIVGTLPAIWAVIVAKADGIPTNEIILIASSVLATSMMVAHYGIQLTERAVQEIGGRRDGDRVRRILEERKFVGDPAIGIEYLATIWAGTDSNGGVENLFRWNTKFRLLKMAVSQGLIEGTTPDGDPSSNTVFQSVESDSPYGQQDRR
jgi:hypothetical protein